MRKLLLFSLLNLYLFTNIFGQEKSFQIYNEDGKKVSYRIMSQSAGKADVVLFGENHNDPISHWLQLELTKSLFEKHAENLMLGAEMLESDDQIKLDEYLLGFIREKDFEKESKIWTNHKTDYRPLVSFAKENKIDFVATNIPRRFANMVYRFGIDTLEYLPEKSKQFIQSISNDYYKGIDFTMDKTRNILDTSIITHRDSWDKEIEIKLKTILKRYKEVNS